VLFCKTVLFGRFFSRRALAYGVLPQLLGIAVTCRLIKLLGLGGKEPYFVGFICTRASYLAPQKIATQCRVAIATPPNKTLVLLV